MAIDFNYPIETSPDGYPAKYLGLDSTDTWHVVTYYIEADDDEIETGWVIVEVNDDGITRADIEGEVVDPDPLIVQAVVSKTITIGVYSDSSISMNSSNPEALPFGEIGRISLTYEEEAGKLIAATVNSILPDRG